MYEAHPVRFPGAVYRNKTKFHGNIYCNRYSTFSAFFNIFATGIETFVIPWDQLLNTRVVEVCRLRLELLCGNHLRLSVSLKTLMEFLERSPLSLVSTTEELLDRKVAAPV
jgi:hypothetical protein